MTSWGKLAKLWSQLAKLWSLFTKLWSWSRPELTPQLGSGVGADHPARLEPARAQA